ncbi:trypsin-like peptidase domain-containing protein [Phenylobacterium sp.]|uniref:S1C family serine protease n=1 Tax=Phenylobacterium sp. TaxID=1871053 RepID=UPI0028A0E76E|nr:trypsin-like peptidase domain-containing protein [Phenylobacterium sp.]
MRTQQLLYAAAGVVVFIMLLLVGWGLSHRGERPAPARGGFVSAVERAQAATVMLTVSGSGGNNDGAPMQMGSGFVVSADGLVVTAAHVTGAIPVVNLVFADGTVARAELVGADESVDVAVFRATPGRQLTALSFADSNQVKAGQPVVLMGAPYGLVGTATSGIVSAVNRQIGAPMDEDDPFAGAALRGPVKAYLQTDAALTAGGSGGPLLNAAGQVIGMASARESRGEPGAGLAFAIPSNVVRDVIERVKAAPQPQPTPR